MSSAARSWRTSSAASYQRRAARLTTRREVRRSIVSVAGLAGAPVRNQRGQQVGRLVDVIARLHGEDRYPPITGLLIKVGSRTSFLGADAIDSIEHRAVTLSTARLDLRDFRRRQGEVVLSRDVLDHQLVDVDGRQVIRAADLYLARVAGEVRLVGLDVSVATLLRRLGPRRLRGRPTPERVIDWDAVAPFGEDLTSIPATVQLRASDEDLHRLHPGDLADLLEDLGRGERRDLLARLDPATAADALEEMDPEELEALLREENPQRAAQLISSMEPDEAVDALRDLSASERKDILAAVAEPETRDTLEQLLAYPERTAGGFMTTVLATAGLDDTVGEVHVALAGMHEHRNELDAVVVLDEHGALVADLPLFDLVIHPDADTLRDIMTHEHHRDPITVEPDANVAEVAEQLVRTRRSSLLVTDERGRPLGRILADDVLDAVLPERGRLHFPRLLQ